MSGVTFILGRQLDETLDAALARLSKAPAWTPFDPRAIAFVGRFSRRLMRSPFIRQFPELAALGHWFRPARLHEMMERHAPRRDDSIALGRGLAFHLAPANVDSIFMYSWLISLLAGNSNIARLSQKASAQVESLIDVLRETLSAEAIDGIDSRLMLLTYPHDDSITQLISSFAQVRVTWGGDATVAAIRAIPLRPTATEIVFPDRFSMTAIRAESVNDVSDEEIDRLATFFCNDALWFGQQACSSPRMVAFVGHAASIAPARERFWNAVDREAARRAPPDDAPSHITPPDDSSSHITPPDDASSHIARLAATCEYAAHAMARPEHGVANGRQLQRLTLEQPLGDAMRELHCGNGLFLEQAVDDLPALARQLSDRDQTLSVFGFGGNEIQSMIPALPPRAIDRIVDVGDALTFDPVWDGQDLFDAFSRRVRLPAHV